MITFLHSFPC